MQRAGANKTSVSMLPVPSVSFVSLPMCGLGLSYGKDASDDFKGYSGRRYPIEATRLKRNAPNALVLS